MRNVLNVLIVLILVSLSFGALGIQPAHTSRAYINCDPAAFLDSLSEFKSTGDGEKDLTLISALEHDLIALRAACSPLQWEGEGEILTPVFELPAGVYRAEVTSKDSFVGDLEVITGDCEMEYFSARDGNSSSKIIRSEGCTAVFQVNASLAPWKITVTRLN